MKVKYITGLAVIVGIVVVAGVLMARHQSQNNSISNTPNAVTTANNTQATQPTNNSGNNQVTPQSGSNATFQKGKIGDTFSVTQASASFKLKLIQVAPYMAWARYVETYPGAPTPESIPEIAAKFEVTNTGNQKSPLGNIDSMYAYSDVLGNLNNPNGKSAPVHSQSLLPNCTNSYKTSEDFFVPAGASETVCFMFPKDINIVSIFLVNDNNSPLVGWDVK